MDTLLRSHNGFGLPHPLQFHGSGKKTQVSSLSPLVFPSVDSRFHEAKISVNPTKTKCTTTSGLFDLVPEIKKENLDVDIPLYDPSQSVTFDLVIVGCGPAGLTVAQNVSEAGLSVCCIDPAPKLIWPNNYGVWIDEFKALDLLDCLDATWSGAVVHIDDDTQKNLDRPYGRVNRKHLKSKVMKKCISNEVTFHEAKVLNVVHEESKSFVKCNDGVTVEARVVLDATGFSKRLVEYDKPYNPGYQVAYGILAEVEEHPFEVDKMLFMDWRDSHLKHNKQLNQRNSRIPTFLYAMPFSSNRIFLEETSLVARPGLGIEDIQQRMEARLKHLGINVKYIEEDEVCVIPMGGVLPVLPQRTLGIGGTAGMVHPSTGYMVARTLATAPLIAQSIVNYLNCWEQGRGGGGGDSLSAKVWRDLWPVERRRQREFFCFGMDVLLKLDLEGTRRFFDAFFELEPHYWHGFLSSRLFLPELFSFGLSLFAHASNTSKLEIMAKGTLPLINMSGNLLRDRD